MRASTLGRDHADLDARLCALAERRTRPSPKRARRDVDDTLLPARAERNTARPKPPHRARVARLVTVALSSSAFVTIVAVLGVRGTSTAKRIMQPHPMQSAAPYRPHRYSPAVLHARAETTPRAPACTGSKC